MLVRYFERKSRSGLLLQPLLVGLLLSPIIKQTTNTPISPMAQMFENVSLSTVEMIKNNGYTVEVHNVVTKYGYILELHRIPRSKSGQKPTRNHPVFMHHGILGSSADWVLGGANISLPMLLADDGYDVWLSNCRGNTYSMKHVSMTYKQRAFWDFSLNEIGKYDLPAAIDYILFNTKVQQLHYVGYSMGTCVFYIMASERPEYQPKIRSQVSLAPVAYLYNTRSFLKYIAPYAKILNMILQKVSNGMLMPQSKIQTFFATTLCREKLTQKLVCEKCFIFSVCGTDPYFFDSNLIPIIIGHFPAGTSAKLSEHFAQFILKDCFGKYDYGSKLNMKYYNSTVPPLYDLKSIQVPITLIYGENDILADTKDVMKLKDQLPKLMDAFPVNNSYCNHVDFLWGLNVKKDVNDPIKGILNTTDDTNWVYTGPNPTMTNEISTGDKHTKVQITVVRPPQEPTSILNFVPGLDYFAENLEAIITNAMPRFVKENDVTVFEQERDLQKALFRSLIEFVKSSEIEYGQLMDDLVDEIFDWTDREIADARQTVKSHAKKIAFLINGKMAYVDKTVTNEVGRAGSFVIGSVGKAENFVVGGVGKAESFVVGTAVKAEQSVVSSMVKAENFVSYGLNQAEWSVGNAFKITTRRLNRVFWFLK